MNLYALYKATERLYAAGPRLLGGFDGRALPPLQVVLELTYRCNLACEFCYQRREEDQLGVRSGRDELTPDEVRSIVTQTPPWTLIILSGGELFVRRDAMDILSATVKQRRTHVVTNGTCITPEIAEQIVSIGLTSVGISIEGSREINDRVRGHNSFARAVAAVNTLLDHKRRRGTRFPLVNLKTTITTTNVGNLEEVLGLALEMGVDYCSLQIMNTSVMISGLYLHSTLEQYGQQPPPIADFPLDLLEEQLRKVKESAAKSGVRLRLSPDLTSRQIRSHYANQIDLGDYLCLSPWTGMNVSATGEVFPCLNYRIGSLRDQRLMELWNGERYREFRRSLLTKGLFAGCRGCCDLTSRPGRE